MELGFTGPTALLFLLLHFNYIIIMPAFNLQLPVAIGCDHAGVDYKEDLISFLEGRGVAFTDFGTHSKESVDYPDFAHPVAVSVEKGESAFGILICGSANGVAITANKHQGIRAAICWGEELAQLARQHNNANIICIPARFVREGDAEKMVDLFMTTPFEGGRHENRVKKIAC
jgi:ribose 5-phosphate isomerase B